MIDLTAPIKLEPDKHYLEWLERQNEPQSTGFFGRELKLGPMQVAFDTADEGRPFISDYSGLSDEDFETFKRGAQMVVDVQEKYKGQWWDASGIDKYPEFNISPSFLARHSNLSIKQLNELDISDLITIAHAVEKGFPHPIKVEIE